VSGLWITYQPDPEFKLNIGAGDKKKVALQDKYRISGLLIDRSRVQRQPAADQTKDSGLVANPVTHPVDRLTCRSTKQVNLLKTLEIAMISWSRSTLP